jgi:DNA-binding winged helix-turn-helix (wHTH) protein/tetratricopeptide (TPR) repeat protein
MIRNDSAEGVRDPSVLLWKFANCEFDELRRELRVNGSAVDLEAKPLEVLSHLLQHAGEVVTKDELLESVWPGTAVVDGSLATAISKLRKAIGDEDQLTILTVPRTGYRLAVPVQSKPRPSGLSPELGLRAGDAVPGRDQWRLTRSLEFAGSSEVWIAENPKTRESRVFKFASDGLELKGLKREVTLARFLRESLGDRPDFVRVLEWNFDSPPFFLESEYGGVNLAEWADSQSGLLKVPVAFRLRMLIDIAKAVAAAHEVGVLHKDLKPANVLISSHGEDRQIKVADFGSGALADPTRLGALGITNLGFTQTATADSTLTGTLTYLAPEVLGGNSPTTSSDVYALGVILYQLIVGDFRKPLSPGWEADVADPLLREDIAEAACGDPARRLKSAAELVERLDNLQKRRVERDRIQLAEQRAAAAEKKLSEARARRPWIIAAVASLVVGLGASLFLYRRAVSERKIADRQTEIASAVNRFLANDLLGRSNPFNSGKADESLTDAVKRASPAIDRQFANEPKIAAQLHQTIARALDLRTDYPEARKEYDRADALFKQSDGDLSQDAIIVNLQRAALEARSYQGGTLDQAKAILSSEEAKIDRIAHPRTDLRVWLSNARGMIALIDNNAQSAKQNFQAASDLAVNVSQIDENTRLSFKQRLAFSNIRLGNGVEAERLFRELISAYSRTSGADGPDVLRVRLNLAQAFMIQNKNAEAVDETNQIYPNFVAKLGRDHELSMQVLATRAQCEGTLGRWDDAIRDGMALHELAVQKQGPSAFFSIASLADAATAQCRSGRLSEGEANVRSAYETAKKAFGDKAGLTGATADALADCLIARNRLDEAAKLLDSIDPKVVAQLVGVPDWSATLDVSRAEIALRRGDYAAAEKHVQPAIPVYSRADAEPYQKQRLQKVLDELDRSRASRQ